jgi:hypothetical protein
MTALQVLLQSRCRREVLRAAALLGACLLAAVVAVLLATTSRTRALDENMEEQGAAAAAAQTGTTGADVEAALPKLIAETARLQTAGFDRPADRVAWVDTAVRALDRLHPVAYTVEADVAEVQPAGGRLQQRYEEAGLEPPQLERNDMQLRVQGLQEDELLGVIEQVVAQGGGVVRVEHCKLDRRADGVGLDAQCRLARYSLRVAGATP